MFWAATGVFGTRIDQISSKRLILRPMSVFLLKLLQPARFERKLPASLYIAIIFSGGVSTWIL